MAAPLPDQGSLAPAGQPVCGTKGLVSIYWDLHSVPGREGMAAGGTGLEEWSRVCGWRARGFFGN